MAARGQTITNLDDIDLSGLPKATTAKALRYWFDDDNNTLKSITIASGTQVIDASQLLEGLHTVHYQVIGNDNAVYHIVSALFIKMGSGNDAAFTAKKLMYWFDDESTINTVDMGQGVQMLDASTLPEGLHTIHYQVLCSNGILTPAYSSMFMRMNVDTEGAMAKQLRYWFDGDAAKVKVVDVVQGIQMLDVSGLHTGLHTLCCQLIDSEGRMGIPYTRIFIKAFDKVVADGQNRVTKYQYWLNGNSQAMQTVKLDNAANPYQLISLLPMQKEPIRSQLFHFELTDGQPTVYAKNEFHIRFHDAAGYFVDDFRTFVDYSVKQTVEPVDELQATQTFSKVDENDIRWYTVQVAPGDTTAFRLSQPATLQVFAPSGKEVFNTSESASVQWGGIHTWEDGTYYVAVHDVTGSQNNMTLDYMHMDKYDVVDWDVHTVGNGGCSTITFKGNGFRDLYRVDLYMADGDSIHSIDISHDSDAETSVTFDFSGAELGVYNAVFHFTEEDKRLSEVVTVEEATELDFSISASFATQYLQGTTNRYIFNVRNNSNMTAYHVPLPIHIYAPNSKTLTSVEVGGYSVKDRLKDLLGLNYTDSIDALIANEMKKTKDMYYFLRDTSTDYVNGFPYLYHAYICPNIRPNTTETFSVSITSSGTLYVYMWCPSKETQEQQSGQKQGMRRATVIDDFNCGRATEHERQCEDNKRMIEMGRDPIYNVDCTPSSSGGICPTGGAGGGSTPQPPSDPNDIYGYLSDAGSKFMTDEVAKVNYTIEFENDTAFAQASAHTIVIRDTLDSRYFDLASFLPTSVKIGKREAFLDEAMDVKTSGSVTSFLKTIDMRPEINAIAQVEGDYSLQTGIAKWTFTSLDPMTMEPTDDLMQGILPVNYNGTSGIGEVMFEVGVKPNKRHGTEVKNRASIVFDYEEPILTPTWVNIVDAIRPVSHITDVEQVNNGPTATVSMEGGDDGSGLWRYDVYVQYGSGAWFLAAENVAADTTATVKLYENMEHHFYCLATDMAGNVEQKEPVNEFTLTVGTVYKAGDVNTDGTVGIGDIVAITNVMAGITTDPAIVKRADVNGDGTVGIGDIVAITNIMAGKP